MGKVRNILFAMCDQLRFDYLSCMGHPRLETPNIDRLAAQGVLFRHAYCNSPVCGPSRMSFYTGRYPTSHGTTWNAVPLSIRELTLGDYLRPAGLSVALVGKTHVVPDLAGMARFAIDPKSPQGRLLAEGGFAPFDRHEGHLAPPPDSPYNQYLRAAGYAGDNPWEDYANGADDGDGGVVSGWAMRNARRPARVDRAHSETAYTTDRAIAFIAAQGDRPWLLHLSYIKPHWPYLAPAPYNDMYGPNDCIAVHRRPAERDAPHPVIAAYFSHDECQAFARDEVVDLVKPTYMGLVKEIDDNLGRLFDMLDEAGRMADTLIVFTSDHGDFLGDHWLGEKEIFYEAAARIPLIVYDPDPAARPRRGAVEDRFAEGVDLLPTFLEALGLAVPEHLVEGRSLLPLTRGGPADDWREAVVSELDYSYRRARQVLGLGAREGRAWMIRDRRWKYVHWRGFPPQLFDLDQDPGEFVDLGSDPGHAGVVADMRGRLFDWLGNRKTRTTAPDADVLRSTDSHRKRGIHIGIW